MSGCDESLQGVPDISRIALRRVGRQFIVTAYLEAPLVLNSLWAIMHGFGNKLHAILRRLHGRKMASMHKFIPQTIDNYLFGRVVPVVFQSLGKFHVCRAFRCASHYNVAEVSRKFMQLYARLQHTTSFVPPMPPLLHARLAFAIIPLDRATISLGFAKRVPPILYIAAEPDSISLPCADVLNIQVRL